MMMQLKSPETRRNLLAGLAENEAAANERSDRSTKLMGEAQQAARDAEPVRKDLEQAEREREQAERRCRDLQAELKRLGDLETHKRTEAGSVQESALAALAQADDLRGILALVAPEALKNGNGQAPAAATPQDMRVAGTPETASFPAAPSAPNRKR